VPAEMIDLNTVLRARTQLTRCLLASRSPLFPQYLRWAAAHVAVDLYRELRDAGLAFEARALIAAERRR